MGGTQDYTVAHFYNQLLKVQKKLSILRSPQSITMEALANAAYMPWPLAPPKGYESPMRGDCSDGAGHVIYGVNYGVSYGAPGDYKARAPEALAAVDAAFVSDDSDEDSS